MKRQFILSLLCFFISIPSAFSQSSAVKKIAQATFTLSTFKADGSLIASANGVFLKSTGEAVAPWKPFVGADHAVVIDAKGQKHDVELLLGANNVYNLAKFQVNGKVPATATIASSTASGNAWVVTTPQSNAPQKASITSTDKFLEKYNYYILSTSTADEQFNGAAVCNDGGQLIGLFDKSGELVTATDVNCANDFALTGLSLNDKDLEQCDIRLALPTDEKQALIALMLSSGKKADVHEATVRDFISKFPKANEGYYALAGIEVAKGVYDEADKTMIDAIATVTNKDEAHSNYAQLIYFAVINPQTDGQRPQSWTLDKAMSEAETAYKINPLPAYQHTQALITFAQGKYQDAYNRFEALTKTSFKNPELYLEMAQSQEQLNGSDQAILDLLEQAVALCDTPYVATSAPYFYARGIQYNKMGKYRLAMADLMRYEYFNLGRLDASFYYMREQIESKGRIYQQALNDILVACQLEPNNPVYSAEAGSLLLRVNKPEAALSAAQHSIDLQPDYSDAYLILGLAQVQLQKKEEGIKNIQKAKELGNAQADSFLEKVK